MQRPRSHGRALALTLVLCASSAPSLAREGEQADTPSWGHSSHGSAYDEGPRQRPWRMEGIGKVSMPITTNVPEVQEWFDQGMALMHGFWSFEAERSFRWCLKLDPECAMAYWGMALATMREMPGSESRADEFLARAVELKDTVSEREQAYIEVLAAFHAAKPAGGPAGPGGPPDEEAVEVAMGLLDRLVMDHPQDVEAKALFWLLAGRAGRDARHVTRYGLEAVLDDILEVEPDHVGALHFRIHNWDGEDGRYVVDSCMRLGQVAPRCGHLLHMPGHVLSGIGLWHEAAISMDRATREEKAYMHDRVIVPEDNWDYVHNLDYLGYIQEQLGMADQALIGARELQRGPDFARVKALAAMAKLPTMRVLIKFERWEELLEIGPTLWDPTSESERILAAYGRTRARLGLGQIDEAESELEALRGMLAAPGAGPGGPGAADGPGEGGPAPAPPSDPSVFILMGMRKQYEARLPELEALLTLARGESLEGLSLLAEAAKRQQDEWRNDPPSEPTFLYNRLGDAYLDLGAPKLALECYERTLETVIHDGFALAGLVVAHAQLGNTESAEAAMAKLGVVWSDADPNRWLDAALATGIRAAPELEAPIEQRNYKEEVLDPLGPSLWTRPQAPQLSALDAQGQAVSLDDYLGRNVVAIFYLGDECLHCMEQIALAEERLEALEQLDTVVLAISKDSVEEIAEQAPDFGIELLSDTSFASAHRFRSYDDFEELELHSTFVIDAEGRVHWSRIGGDPYTDFDFIESQLAKLQREHGPGEVVREQPVVGQGGGGDSR